jgi:hypothetical protein
VGAVEKTRPVPLLGTESRFSARPAVCLLTILTELFRVVWKIYNEPYILIHTVSFGFMTPYSLLSDNVSDLRGTSKIYLNVILYIFSRLPIARLPSGFRPIHVGTAGQCAAFLLRIRKVSGSDLSWATGYNDRSSSWLSSVPIFK